MDKMLDLWVAAPLLCLAVSALVVLLLTVAGGWKRPAPSGQHLLMSTLLGLISSLVFLYKAPFTTAFSGALSMDGVAVAFGVPALLAALASVLVGVSYIREHRMSEGEFFALILLSCFGILMVCMAGDMMILFMGIEIMSLSVYVLAAYKRSSHKAAEAGLKYFVYGAFASSFMLFGMALLYGEVGKNTGVPSVAFAALKQTFASGRLTPVMWVASALWVAGLLFKTASVPFHMWAPDVYEGAPTPSTAFMAAAVKTAAFAALIRLLGSSWALVALPERMPWASLLACVAVASMVLGNMVAVRQTQIKRMLAYSSIAHAGYALVGVVAYLADPTGPALRGVAYYMCAYALVTVGAFGVVSAFERRADARVDLPLERLAGIAHRYPALGMAMAVCMFALAGIPPTAGFFGKISLFMPAVQAGYTGLLVLAVLASAVGAYYYLRVLVVMYMRATDSQEQPVSSVWLTTGLVFSVTAVLYTGLMPDTYVGFLTRVLSGW
jgi:NADH-quinone oxidoreductase subunit N